MLLPGSSNYFISEAKSAEVPSCCPKDLNHCNTALTIVYTVLLSHSNLLVKKNNFIF